MKNSTKIKLNRKHGKFALFFFMALLFAQCFKIISVDQPASTTAGSTITVTLQAEVDPSFDLGDPRLVAAVLVPKSWNASTNTTMTYTSSRGNGTMSLIPSSVIAPSSTVPWPQEIRSRIGIGDNLIDEVEWVAFWSDQIFSVTDEEATITGAITITMKAGPQNTNSQIGYLIAGSTTDLSSTDNYSTFFPACFQVTNGAGAVIDFCNPQIASISPIKSLDNDIITVNFDASVGNTELAGKDKVFLCATAYVDGNPITKCDQSASTAMTNEGPNVWRLDIWPRQYFNLTDGQTLDYIEYSFTDETGVIVVVDPGSGLPLVYEFACE